MKVSTKTSKQTKRKLFEGVIVNDCCLKDLGSNCGSVRKQHDAATTINA